MVKLIFNIFHKSVLGNLCRMTEVNKGPKASNSHSLAYMDTVEGELRSKSKPLRSKLFCFSGFCPVAI